MSNTQKNSIYQIMCNVPFIIKKKFVVVGFFDMNFFFKTSGQYTKIQVDVVFFFLGKVFLQNLKHFVTEQMDKPDKAGSIICPKHLKMAIRAINLIRDHYLLYC